MNEELTTKLKAIGVGVPEILLPKDGVDLNRWSVVACDQFTSEPEYWNAVDAFVNGAPSTLRITYPEVYLEETDKEERISKINQTMSAYLENRILEKKFNGFVLVDRQTIRVQSRKGLVVALDLERYDYNKGSKTLIRATEGTVIDRIPPRLAIRKNALVELPHIMVLIDDPKKTVIEPLFSEKLETVYDFGLMMDGGHIKGYKIEEERLIGQVADSLAKLISSGGLLFAMGDGNHSLATAKAHWDGIKQGLTEEEKETHPARFALVELVNVHDDGLQFEPIHRVVFNVNKDELLQFLGSGSEIDGGVEYVAGSERMGLVLRENSSNLTVGNLQKMLDEYLTTHPEAKIDYVHGEEAVQKLALNPKNIGFLLPVMEKTELFKTVELDGALPRKTFSMGEAQEKRYYLEARKIVR